MGVKWRERSFYMVVAEAVGDNVCVCLCVHSQHDW